MKSRIVFVSALVAMTSIAGDRFAVAEDGKQKDSARGSMSWGPAGDAPKAIIDRSIAAHRNLKGVPASVLDKSQCVVIVPGLTTAAIGVGGSHGDGVAVCRTADRSWSRPAFVDFDAASLGVQVGAKNTDLVLYLTSKRAEQSLKEGNISFGADASVVAGNFERTFDVSRADAVAYQNNSGAFVGASVGTGAITVDNDSNRAFYGKALQASEILNGKESPDNQAVDLLMKQLG